MFGISNLSVSKHCLFPKLIACYGAHGLLRGDLTHTKLRLNSEPLIFLTLWMTSPRFHRFCVMLLLLLTLHDFLDHMSSAVISSKLIIILIYLELIMISDIHTLYSIERILEAFPTELKLTSDGYSQELSNLNHLTFWKNQTDRKVKWRKKR